MRVRWMEDPVDGRMAFLPVFDSETCDYGEDRARFGLSPACVGACPTGALIFGDHADPGDPVLGPAQDATPLSHRGDTKVGVLYIGHKAWQEGKLNDGVALHPDDEDIIYEQGRSE
jgi:Fe-S-cluster-containing dehydrogenase component